MGRAPSRGRGGVAAGAVGVAVASLALLAPPATTAEADIAGLAGSWQRNAEQSDDPREQMQAAMGRVRGGGRGAMPGRGGMGGRGGMPGRGGMRGRGGMSGRGGGAGGPFAMLPGDRLEIEVSDSEVRMWGAQGQLRILRPDGEKRRRTGPDGSELEMRCRWEDGVLVVESKSGRGMKTTERYTVAPEGQLVVTLRLESPRFEDPVHIHTYFDPKREPDPAPTPQEPDPQGRHRL